MTNKTKKKGEFLEQLTAFLYEIAGDKVSTNVKIPTVDGTNRKREIDVVLKLAPEDLGNTSLIIPIECKNYGKTIGVDQIDAFVGKLIDIGIDPSLGIYVAASKYSSGALKRAKAAGIQTLIARGLTKDRMAQKIEKLLHSVVFWVPEWISTSTFPFLPAHATYPDAIQAKLPPNSNWEIGAIDVAWKLWVSGSVPCEVGEHIIFIEKTETEKAICTIDVQAYQMSIIGKNKSSELADAKTEKPIKSHSQSTIEIPENAVELTKIRNLGHLTDLNKKSDILVNLRLPRIRSMHVYWPISNETKQKIIEFKKTGEKPSFEKLEGTNILNAWTRNI